MSNFGKVGILIFTVLMILGNAMPGLAADSNSLSILRQALLGAGTGAIAAEVSGGKAGQGALVGAGIAVVGGALLDLLIGPSPAQQPIPAPVVYAQSATSYQPAPPAAYQQPTYYNSPQPVYYAPQPQRVVYADPQVYYVPQSQPAPAYYSYARREDPNRRILRQGLIGAATGAISAEVSGGKAGTGALVGAGTNVIGSALLELLSS